MKSVCKKLINGVKTDVLLPIIKEKMKPDSVVYTDTFRSYNILDVSEFKHFRIDHASSTPVASEKFAEEKNHINGIENLASARRAWNPS